MTADPLLIGITGGIGAGKSIVCRIFQALKVPVYNADDRAKWLMTHNQSLIEEIKKHFGPAAYLENNQLNKTFLASAAFNDKEKLKRLNELVHPKVGEDFARWAKKNKDNPYLIKEAALLFESGSYRQLDKVVNVDAPKALRLERVLLRDTHRKQEDVEAIMAKQFNDQQRRKMADYIIINDGHNLVIPQVLKLHEQFTAARKPEARK